MRTVKTTSASIVALCLLVGAAVGVAAQDEEAAAGSTSFTGTISRVEVAGGSTDAGLGDGNNAYVGRTVLNRMESNDPRFTGDHRVVVTSVNDLSDLSDASDRVEWVVFGVLDTLVSTTHEVTTDGGRWLGEGARFSSSDLGLDLDLLSGGSVVFVGRDGYEGLTAYARIDDTQQPPTISGVILFAAMSQVPESYAGE